jgi:putative ubiquitin-RnfH superfamily antitoxin RatB of RatAB toxin-antitoxin module
MDIRSLINEMHEIRLQRQELLKQEGALRQKQDELEAEIKLKLDDMNEEYESLSEEEFQMMLSDMADFSQINVEVVYALPKKQTIKEIQVPKGATIEDSIRLSGILTECPEIDIKSQKVGIHGMVKPLSDIVHIGDRVEIYRSVSKTE